MTTLLDKEVGFITYYEDGKVRQEPGYMCGHCNAWIILSQKRLRERVRCGKCGKLICERTKTCTTECVPVVELMKDKLEGPVARKWSVHLEDAFSGK